MGVRIIDNTVCLIKTHRPLGYTLTLNEFYELKEAIDNDAFHGICKTFDYGFILGARCYANGKITKAVIYGRNIERK